MKTIIILLLSIAPVLWSVAQTNTIPNVDLRDLNGRNISSHEIIRTGAPTLLVFWKSTNSECCANLENLEEAWVGSLKNRGVRMVVICTDCNGNWSSVKPLVNGNGWEFETYVDVNGDFRRAMNVGEGPCTMLFSAEETMVCRYNAACTGGPDYICDSFMKHLESPMSMVEMRAGK